MHENLATRVKVNTRPAVYICWKRENSGSANGAPGQASRSRAAEQHIMDSTGLLCFACFYLDAFWWLVLFGSVVLFFFSWLLFTRVSKGKGVVYVYREADSHVLELYTFLVFTNTSLRTKVGG